MKMGVEKCACQVKFKVGDKVFKSSTFRTDNYGRVNEISQCCGCMNVVKSVWVVVA